MKTLTNRLWIVIMIIGLLSVMGFFASRPNNHGGGEAYAQTMSEEEKTALERTPPKGIDSLSCPSGCRKLYIYLDDYGYSDWFWYWYPKHHEILSGEWAAAIYYKSIASSPKAMWLTHDFFCPDWVTNSNFSVVTGLHHTAPNQLSSTIQNSQVRIDIIATMYCSKTAMGIGPNPVDSNYVESDTCFMVQDYIITNITGAAIDSLYFYQFLHGHPGENYDSVVTGVYDTHFHPITDPQFPNSPNYHYDITMWANKWWDHCEYIEYIGFGAKVQPTRYDVWQYPSFFCEGGRPADGLHVRVENKDLHNTFFWGPDQTAGAEEWYLGTLSPTHPDTISVLFSVASYRTTTQCTPTMTQWGLIVLVALLVASAVFVMLRRRKASMPA